MTRVHVLTLPNVELLDLAGPVQVFDYAAQAGTGHEVAFVGAQREVASTRGLVLGGIAELPDHREGDLVLVSGLAPTPARTDVDPAVIEWLQAAGPAGATIASVCSAAFVLGYAGLLDGRRATTHWSLVPRLAAEFPRAHVEDAALFVQDRGVTTSAGVASGIDMALWLVEQDHGPILTARVARELVVYLRRDGRHRQTSVYLDYRTHLNPAVHRAQDWLLTHFTEKVTLDELAAQVGTSGRHLSRGFRSATGLTPLAYQQRLRLELASSLMEDPELTLAAIAARCGFEDDRSLRRLWQEHYGRPPSQTRAARARRAPSGVRTALEPARV